MQSDFQNKYFEREIEEMNISSSLPEWVRESIKKDLLENLEHNIFD